MVYRIVSPRATESLPERTSGAEGTFPAPFPAMRRLLLPLLVVSVVPFAGPASAGCEYDPEGNPQCHPTDCLPYDPTPPAPKEIVGYVTSGDPARAVTWAIPPVCPA